MRAGVSTYSYVLLAILTGLLLTPLVATAHSVYMTLEIVDDGKLRIETGFSDGTTGAGLKVELREKSTGRVVGAHTMPESGIVEVDPPRVPYTATLLAGEGHEITKEGPLPGEAHGDHEHDGHDHGEGGHDHGEHDGGGRLFLVSMGPGAPEYLTQAALDALKAADIVVCFRRTAERFDEVIEGAELRKITDRVLLGFGHGDEPLLTEAAEKRAEKAHDARHTIEHIVEDGMAAKKTVALLAEGDFLRSPDWAWAKKDFEEYGPVVIGRRPVE